MVRVVPVNLTYNPHTLWFDPLEFDIHKDDPVIVETVRGIEFARVADEIFEVEDSAVKTLKSPLKPIKRVADHKDITRADELEKRGRDALGVFRKMVDDCKLKMRPISVEFLFDGDKAIFYFEAEERVDFRELVRKLASRFHIRVDMRQIGARDEARVVGGIGHCGQELCCKRMGGNFNTVSIRMAKAQDLSLNPQSISGLCGRLMCCLRFEYDAYKDFKSRSPKINAEIETPSGTVKVTGLDVPREIVCLQDTEGKKVYVPLCDFEPPEKGQRPCAIGAHAWEQASAETVSGYSPDSSFSRSAKTNNESNAKNAESSSKTKKHDRNTQSSSSHNEEFSELDDNAPAGEDAHKTRRRRSTKIASGSTVENSSGSGVRVGQKSSGLSRNATNDRSKSSRNSRSENNKGKRQRSQSSNNRNNNKQSQTGNKKKAPQKTSGISQDTNRNKNNDRHRKKRSRTAKTPSGGDASKNNSKGETTKEHTP